MRYLGIGGHETRVLIKVFKECGERGNRYSVTITSSSAIAERPRDARVTSIRKIAKWNF